MTFDIPHDRNYWAQAVTGCNHFIPSTGWRGRMTCNRCGAEWTLTIEGQLWVHPDARLPPISRPGDAPVPWK